GMFVYLIPCTLLMFYIVEKTLLQFGYVATPGSSTAIDEYNNIAFLAFTWELFLIQNVQESINKSISQLGSGSQGAFNTSIAIRRENILVSDSTSKDAGKKSNEEYMLDVVSPTSPGFRYEIQSGQSKQNKSRDNHLGRAQITSQTAFLIHFAVE
ncbi:hypothetical protein HK096_003956, partial [Nowakowskiella sp. JEL0078]